MTAGQLKKIIENMDDNAKVYIEGDWFSFWFSFEASGAEVRRDHEGEYLALKSEDLRNHIEDFSME